MISVLQGGRFGNGFFSAGFTKGVMSHAGFDYSNGRPEAIIGRTVMAGIVGGTASEISGGKFANGASTAAMAQLFNAESAGFQERARERIGPLQLKRNGNVSLEFGASKSVKGLGVAVTTDGENLTYAAEFEKGGIVGGVSIDESGSVTVMMGAQRGIPYVANVGLGGVVTSDGDLGVQASLTIGQSAATLTGTTNVPTGVENVIATKTYIVTTISALPQIIRDWFNGMQQDLVDN